MSLRVPVLTLSVELLWETEAAVRVMYEGNSYWLPKMWVLNWDDIDGSTIGDNVEIEIYEKNAIEKDMV